MALPFISVISLLSVKVCPSCEALICIRIPLGVTAWHSSRVSCRQLQLSISTCIFTESQPQVEAIVKVCGLQGYGISNAISYKVLHSNKMAAAQLHSVYPIYRIMGEQIVHCSILFVCFAKVRVFYLRLIVFPTIFFIFRSRRKFSCTPI